MFDNNIRYIMCDIYVYRQLINLASISELYIYIYIYLIGKLYDRVQILNIIFNNHSINAVTLLRYITLTTK